MARTEGYNREVGGEDNTNVTRKNQPVSNRAAAGGARPRVVTPPPQLPVRPNIENVSEQKDTSQPGNSVANIVAGYKPKPPAVEIKTQIAIEEIAEVVKSEPEPLPVQPLVIPAPVLLPPPIELVFVPLLCLPPLPIALSLPDGALLDSPPHHNR